MRVHMTVEWDGTTLDIKSNLWAMTLWERKYKVKFFSAWNEGKVGMEDLAYLAYETMRTTGITVPAVFDDFLKRCEALDLVSIDTARPTPGEPTDGN